MPDDVLAIRIEDTLPIVTLQLKNADGSVVALNDPGDTVTIRVKEVGAAVADPYLVEAAMNIETPAQGIVNYTFDAADVDAKGVFNFWVKVVFDGGGIQSFPQDGTFTLVIEDGTIASEPVMRLRARLGDRFRANDRPFFTNYELSALLDLYEQNVEMAALEGWYIKKAEYAELHDITESGSERKLSQKYKHASEMVKTLTESNAVILNGQYGGRVAGKTVYLDESRNPRLTENDTSFPGMSALPDASEFVRSYPLYRFRAIMGSRVYPYGMQS